MKGVWRSPALPAGWTQRPITSKGADMSPGGRRLAWRVTGGPNQRWKAQRWTWGGDDEVGYGNEYETEFEADDFTTVYVWLQIEGACAGQPSDIYADLGRNIRNSSAALVNSARQVGKSAALAMRYGGTVTGRVHHTFNPTPHQLPSITAAVIDEASVITDQAVDAMRAYCTNGVKFGQGFWVSRTVDPNRPLDSFDRNTLASAIGLAISSN